MPLAQLKFGWVFTCLVLLLDKQQQYFAWQSRLPTVATFAMNPYNSVQVTPQKKENPPFSIGATSSNQAYKIVSNFHGPLVPLNFGDILGVLIST